MECLLEANPEPEVTWFKGVQVSSSTPASISEPKSVSDGATFFFMHLCQCVSCLHTIDTRIQGNYTLFALQMVQEQGRISMYKKICGKDQYVVSVTIMSPVVEDGGQWRCNAFNPFGDSNANIALNFESKCRPDSLRQM